MEDREPVGGTQANEDATTLQLIACTTTVASSVVLIGGNGVRGHELAESEAGDLTWWLHQTHAYGEQAGARVGATCAFIVSELKGNVEASE